MSCGWWKSWENWKSWKLMIELAKGNQIFEGFHLKVSRHAGWLKTGDVKSTWNRNSFKFLMRSWADKNGRIFFWGYAAEFWGYVVGFLGYVAEFKGLNCWILDYVTNIKGNIIKVLKLPHTPQYIFCVFCNSSIFFGNIPSPNKFYFST